MRNLTVDEISKLRVYLRIDEQGNIVLLDNSYFVIGFLNYTKSQLILARENITYYCYPPLKYSYLWLRSWCY